MIDKNDIQFSIRLERTIVDKLDKEADVEHRSRNNQIKKIMWDHFYKELNNIERKQKLEQYCLALQAHYDTTKFTIRPVRRDKANVKCRGLQYHSITEWFFKKEGQMKLAIALVIVILTIAGFYLAATSNNVDEVNHRMCVDVYGLDEDCN